MGYLQRWVELWFNTYSGLTGLEHVDQAATLNPSWSAWNPRPKHPGEGDLEPVSSATLNTRGHQALGTS